MDSGVLSKTAARTSSGSTGGGMKRAASRRYFTMPSSRYTNPCAPASTTPAFSRTFICLGVFWSDVRAVFSDSGSSTPKSATSVARSATWRAQSRMTVRIVPSTGRAIALYADSEALTTAAPKARVVTRGESGSPSEKPAEELGQDRAGVAPRPADRLVRQSLRHLADVPLPDAGDAGRDLLERRGDVRAGVAVGNRKDVDLVEGLGALGDEVRAGDDRAREPVAVEVTDRDQGLMVAGYPSGARFVLADVRYSSATAGRRSR